jgi:hypothetical protein
MYVPATCPFKGNGKGNSPTGGSTHEYRNHTMPTVTPSTPNPQEPQPKQNTAKEVIAANVQALIEQLEQGHSEGLTAYLSAMGKFHNYSFGNILEIARQKPDATRVAGLYAWNQLGRKVMKGQKGIRILAPVIGVRRKKDEEAKKDIRTQNQGVLVGFRSAYVFDVSQTDGKELPELSSKVSGDVGERRERLIDFIIAQGILLEFKESIAPALGMSYGGKIAILPGQTPAEEFSTLVHELAHEFLHKAERRTATTKVVRETEAEAMAFVVGQTIGLTNGRASADYTRSKYVEINPEKPDTPEKAKWPEFKTCKFTTEAIVSEGIDKGELRKVCTEVDCTIHHPKKQPTKADASFKAEQDKHRRDEALANATGICVLQTIAAAVPVRLMKRDLLFIAEQMLPLLDEKRVEMVARNRGIRAKEGETAVKLLIAFLRKAEEGLIGRLIVETVILLSARTQNDGGKVLRAAAQAYKVDTDAIAFKVKHEFAEKAKAKLPQKVEAKPVAKAKKAA